MSLRGMRGQTNIYENTSVFKLFSCETHLLNIHNGHDIDVKEKNKKRSMFSYGFLIEIYRIKKA